MEQQKGSCARANLCHCGSEPRKVFFSLHIYYRVRHRQDVAHRTVIDYLMMPPVDISSFASTQIDLLDGELQAELAETSLLASQSSLAALQRAGLAILNLQLASQRTGLGGKTVLSLELDPAVGGGDLPEHGLRVGDIVGVKEQVSGSAKKKDKNEADKNGIEGVVVKVQASSVSVAADKEDIDIPGGKLWM